jgi:hypothetical protein
MTGVHDQGLLFGHLTEVFHGQKVLSPVLENCAITAIGDELIRMLRYRRIQIVVIISITAAAWGSEPDIP